MLNVPAFRETPCGHWRVGVNHFCLEQVHMCSARADAATSPFRSAHQCSVRWCFRVWPDCSTYTLGHSEQGIWYTTPVRWSMGTGSLGQTSWCLRVLCGRKATFMSRGPRILLIVSNRLPIQRANKHSTTLTNGCGSQPYGLYIHREKLPAMVYWTKKKTNY